mmetsp:Transcript_58058/g.164986  ORF Transcript_58058/g.164986 Transcript_58058/m.164986 type:complete len:129 (+) Transcript_58058:27-413(+)
MRPGHTRPLEEGDAMGDLVLERSFASLRGELHQALEQAERAIDRVREERARNAAERSSLEEQFQQKHRETAREIEEAQRSRTLFACCIPPPQPKPESGAPANKEPDLGPDAFGTQGSSRSGVTATLRG